MGILIDSSVLIGIERGTLSDSPLDRAVGADELAIAAITASELLVGVHRAESSTRRRRRSRFVEGALERVRILPFDEEVARTHAALWADLQRAGDLIGAHDLQIAATAVTHDLRVATLNVRDFGRIDGLAVECW